MIFSGNGGADLNLEERCPCGLGHFRVYFPLGNFWHIFVHIFAFFFFKSHILLHFCAFQKTHFPMRFHDNSLDKSSLYKVLWFFKHRERIIKRKYLSSNLQLSLSLLPSHKLIGSSSFMPRLISVLCIQSLCTYCS